MASRDTAPNEISTAPKLVLNTLAKVVCDLFTLRVYDCINQLTITFTPDFEDMVMSRNTSDKARDMAGEKSGGVLQIDNGEAVHDLLLVDPVVAPVKPPKAPIQFHIRARRGGKAHYGFGGKVPRLLPTLPPFIDAEKTNTDIQSSSSSGDLAVGNVQGKRLCRAVPKYVDINQIRFVAQPTPNVYVVVIDKRHAFFCRQAFSFDLVILDNSNRIGKGAYGTVFCAEFGDGGDPFSDFRLILKKFLVQGSRSLEGAEKDCVKEARNLEKLGGNRNFPTFIAIGYHNGTPALAQTIVDGIKVEKFLTDTHHLFDDEDVIDMSDKFFDTLDWLHFTAFMVHADIAQRNLLIDTVLMAFRLIDFGLAKPMTTTMNGDVRMVKHTRANEIDMSDDRNSFVRVLFLLIAKVRPVRDQQDVKRQVRVLKREAGDHHMHPRFNLLKKIADGLVQDISPQIKEWKQVLNVSRTEIGEYRMRAALQRF